MIDFRGVQSKSFPDLCINPDVILCFKEWLGHLARPDQHFPIAGEDRPVLFPLSGNGKHNIGILRFGRQELGMGIDKLNLAVGLDTLLHASKRLERGGCRVVADELDIDIPNVLVARRVLTGQNGIPHFVIVELSSRDNWQDSEDCAAGASGSATPFTPLPPGLTNTGPSAMPPKLVCL